MGQVVWWVSHSSMQAWWNSCLQAGSLLSISSISYSPRHTLQVSPLQVQSCLASRPLPFPPFCYMRNLLGLPARCLVPSKVSAASMGSSVTSSVIHCLGVRLESSAHPRALPVSTSGAAGTLYGYTGKLLMTAASIPSRCGSAGAVCTAYTALIIGNRAFRHPTSPWQCNSHSPRTKCTNSQVRTRAFLQHCTAAGQKAAMALPCSRSLIESSPQGSIESVHRWLTGCGLCSCAYLRQSPAARQNTTESVTPSTMLR